MRLPSTTESGSRDRAGADHARGPSATPAPSLSRTRPHDGAGLAIVKVAPSGSPSTRPDGPPLTIASSDAVSQRGPGSNWSAVAPERPQQQRHTARTTGAGPETSPNVPGIPAFEGGARGRFDHCGHARMRASPSGRVTPGRARPRRDWPTGRAVGRPTHRGRTRIGKHRPRVLLGDVARARPRAPSWAGTFGDVPGTMAGLTGIPHTLRARRTSAHTSSRSRRWATAATSRCSLRRSTTRSPLSSPTRAALSRTPAESGSPAASGRSRSSTACATGHARRSAAIPRLRRRT